ncbi:DUF6331 family protein [Shimia sp. Alg240-R146]|uniref:DUF6331 family protein n=1 Tax=Shimia sp. Alg240-R146 TaxID=2993449 RepID=UPI003FA7CE9F
MFKTLLKSLTKCDILLRDINWLHGIKIVQRTSNSAVKIDEYLKPSARFWDQLEINCDAGCCGLEAFSFKQKDIKCVASRLGEAEVLSQLTELRDQISKHTANTIYSHRLNYWDKKQGFIALLGQIIENFPNGGTPD